MHRLFRWARRLAGAALLAAAAWQIARPWLVQRSGDRRTVSPWRGVGVGHLGERYELRIRPLDPAETAAARGREWATYREAWGAES